MGHAVRVAVLSLLPMYAFGERYELPIPLGLFILAGGAAVLLSWRCHRVEATPGGDW